MLKHIVMWRFKDEFEGRTKEQMMDEQRAALKALPAKIPCIRCLEVGKDVLHTDASYDMVLVSVFENKEKMIEYREHPDHVAVSRRMKGYVTERVCIDYEF